MSSSPNTLPDRPLAESIAVATRSSHTRLNKSIIARLPLVTNAPDPSSYITGLLHIAPIYLTFEACWETVLEISPTRDEASKSDCRPPTGAVVDDGFPSTAAAPTTVQLQEPLVCDRLRTLLQELRLPGLMRSSRLRADIRALTGWSESVVEQQLREVGESGRLGEFTAHIKRSIQHRPHVLIAYSYILYMALFAGGRFIRATLEAALHSFGSEALLPVLPHLPGSARQFSSRDQSRSEQSDVEVSPTTRGDGEGHGDPLSFFRFATREDGEDLKREFKSRLLEAEDILTRQEKHDIIQESICIFDNMELLVHQLDKACAEEDDNNGAVPTENLSALLGTSVAMRLRDSVAVTKDRAARLSSRMSSSSDTVSVWAVLKAQKGYRLDAATSTTDLERHRLPGHPLIPATPGATELCPALKSMRFESNLPIPVRAVAEATEGMKGVHFTNWLLMAAFGAIIIGAFMTTRREMIAA